MKKLLMMMVLSLFSLSGFAQEADQNKKEVEEDSSQDYYVVVEDEATEANPELTATKLPVTLQMAPASVGVVNRSLFETQGATYLSDALRNVSGVNVQSGFGTFDFFTIRGLDSLSNSLVLTDGAAEPEATYYQLYNVERVEVLKGPGAFLYGGNPLSGTVQLVRKQPLFENGFSIYNSYGTFASYKGMVDWNIACGEKGIAFRVNGTWEDANNYRDDKDNHLVAANPSFTWRLNSKGVLNVNFEFVNNEFKPDVGLPVIANQVAGVERTQSYQAPFDVSEQDIARTRLDYEYHVSDSVTLHNKFYYTDLDWRSNGTLFAGFVPAGTDYYIIRTQSQLNDRQKLVGNQFEANFSMQTGSIKHKLLTGFEISRLGDVFTLDVALLPAISVYQPFETATPNSPLIPGLSQAGDARSIVAAPYIVDQISITEQFQIFGGGRLDILDYNDQATSTSRNETQFSPLLGVVFAPAKELSLYANFGKGFAPPSSLVVGERKPEEVTQFEIGTKKMWLDGRLRASAAFYNLEKTNMAIPDDNGITQQTGDLRSRGVEFDLSGRPARGWETYFNYAFNDAELTDFKELIVYSQNPPAFLIADRTGNDPAFAPKHILNLWVLKDLTKQIKIGGGPRYVSSQFISEDNAFQMDGYVTLDAYLGYEIDNWRVNVNFKNITDKEYLTRGFSSTSVIPADPFSVYVGVDFRL